MKIILLEKIRNLGKLGDVASVKNGYARNYLIPYGKGLIATEKNLKEFESRKVELLKKYDATLALAQERAEKLKYINVIIKVKIHDETKLFGSVGPKEISEAITAQGVTIAKSEVSLPGGPIREIGEYDVNLYFNIDVTPTIKIRVEAE